MGKRGPRPKAEVDKRSAAVGIRIIPDLRRRLESAAAASGARTLSQEIERRLIDSFAIDQQIAKQLHGRQNSVLAQLLADGIADIAYWTGRDVWEDAAAFDEVIAFAARLLQGLRPRGRGLFTLQLRGLTGRRSKGVLGKDLAVMALSHHQAAARDDLNFPDHPRTRRINAAALTVASQLARSGYLPNDDLKAQFAKRLAKRAAALSRKQRSKA